MRNQGVSRPKSVWIISIVLGFMAVSQVVILSSFLVLDFSSRSVLDALSAFDWLALYALAAILLTAMVSFFRLRKSSIQWFALYIGLGSWGAVLYAITPEREPHFDELASLAGLLVALAVLGYMVRLRKQRKLA